MKIIKPIETVYSGYRFRSRLEARWAVFFDAAKIKYEYEVEGYDLGEGLRYLPDFWLPGLRVHVEIKPTFEMGWDSIEKIVRFSVNNDNTTLLIVGYPTTHEMYLLDSHTFENWQQVKDDYDEYRAEYGLYADDTPEDSGGYLQACLMASVPVEFGRVPTVRGLSLVFKQGSAYTRAAEEMSSAALLKAKQSRFEHGERG